MATRTPTTSQGQVGTSTASGLGTYLLLLAGQAIGAMVILVNGVPIYRQMVSDPAGLDRHPGIVWWAVAAVTLIQSAYWLRVRIEPPLPTGGSLVIGHLAQFAARLSFILGSSTFTVVFLTRFEELSLPPRRLVMVLALLFSLFCFSLELERVGKALQATKGTT